MENLDDERLKHTTIELLMDLGINLPRHQRTSWEDSPRPAMGGARTHALISSPSAPPRAFALR